MTPNHERTILRAIDRSGGPNRIMTKNVLWAECLLDEGRLSYAGFQNALRSLEEKEQVVVVVGEDRTKVKLTDAGRARLAE
jgi:DNA-binding MarR family transcriptional regulator